MPINEVIENLTFDEVIKTLSNGEQAKVTMPDLQGYILVEENGHMTYINDKIGHTAWPMMLSDFHRDDWSITYVHP